MEGFQTKICRRCNVEQHLYFFRILIAKTRGNFYHAPYCQYCEINVNREFVGKPKNHPNEKFCISCGETKPISEYNFNKRAQLFVNKCKVCCRRRDAAKQIHTRYGVDEAWRESTLVSQDNKCAICKIPFNDTNFKPHIDHSASNGKARAILCPICNIMLGMHHENPNTLRQAGFDRHAEYIEHYKRIHEIKLVG